MNFIQRMTISARLTAGFSLLIALLIVITGVGNSRIAALDRNIETIVHDRMVKLDWTHTIENEVNRQCRAVRTALIASDPTVVSGELAKVENYLDTRRGRQGGRTAAIECS